MVKFEGPRQRENGSDDFAAGLPVSLCFDEVVQKIDNSKNKLIKTQN